MSGNMPYGTMKKDDAIMAAIVRGIIPNPRDHPRLRSDNILWPLLRLCWSTDESARPSASDVRDEVS